MSERRQNLDEHVPQPAEHSPGGYERRDIHFRAIIFFAIVLVVVGAILQFGIWGLYRVFDREAERADPPPNPMVKVNADDKKFNPQDRLRKITRSFPEPRLQYDDVADMKALRSYENEKLGLTNGHPYAWVDKDGGVVRIPIDRAMELVAQRGLGGTMPAMAADQGKIAVPPRMPGGGVTSGQNRGEDAMQSQTGSTLARPNPAGLAGHNSNEPRSAPAGKSPTADEQRAKEGSTASPAGKKTPGKAAAPEVKKPQ